MTKWAEGSVEPDEDGLYVLPCCKFKLPHLPAECSCSGGLGDTIAKVLAKAGVRKREGCGCEKRQEALNRLVPYKKR